MKTLADALLELTGNCGCRMKFISVEHLKETRQIIDGCITEAHLSEKFIKENLGYFEYERSKDLQNVRSVILIAYPQGKTRVIIHHDSKVIETVIPPTYVGLRRKRLEILADLDKVLKDYGYKVAKAYVPEKTLATRSGLSRYGRNNITYIPEFGSLYMLHSYLTDAPLEEDGWGEPAMLDQCRNCTACLKACPTRTIDGKRFLINAERCLTAYTESDEGFPEWIDPNWQKSLLGCFACQQACPANQAFIERVEFEMEFSEEDTRALLKKLPMEKLPEQTADKIKQLGFDPFVGIFSANLKNLINRTR